MFPCAFRVVEIQKNWLRVPGYAAGGKGSGKCQVRLILAEPVAVLRPLSSEQRDWRVKRAADTKPKERQTEKRRWPTEPSGQIGKRLISAELVKERRWQALRKEREPQTRRESGFLPLSWWQGNENPQPILPSKAFSTKSSLLTGTSGSTPARLTRSLRPTGSRSRRPRSPLRSARDNPILTSETF